MKRFIILLISILIAIHITSCEETMDPIDPEPNNSIRVNIELSAREKEIASKQYDFPVNLLAAALDERSNDNVIVSPLSASMVLGMIMDATDIEDRAEILGLLNIEPDNMECFDSYMLKLLDTLPGIDPAATLCINNGFWHHATKVNPSVNYRQLLSEHYLSDIRSFVDFNSSTVKEINNWVWEKTCGGIPELLDERDASLDLNTLWLNALYFKGVWRQKFDKEKTEKKPFYPKYPDTSETANVDMMYGNKFHYVHFLLPEDSDDYDNAITSVMLTYGNESFIFQGVLPAANNPSISSTLEKLDAGYWRQIDDICSYEQKYPGEWIVYMPKISKETTNDLIPVFENMGLKGIFDPKQGVSMAKSLGMQNNQALLLFRQKVILDVDEEGSEIKAATIAGGQDMSNLPPVAIEFNRPFIYFVRERSTGAVLLAGIYQHPE